MTPWHNVAHGSQNDPLQCRFRDSSLYTERMSRRMGVLLAILLTCYRPSLALGDTNATVTPNPAAEDFANEFGLDLTGLELELENQLAELFQVIEPSKYLRALSNTQAFSSKGLGVDYASNPEVVSIGAAGNFTIAVGSNSLEAANVDGVAANIAVTAGVNLGTFGDKRLDGLTVYGNFFTRSGTYRELDAQLSNVGFHAQYKLFRPPGKSMTELAIQWGGFDITTGLEYTKFRLRLQEELTSDISLSDDEDASDVTFASNGLFDYNSTTYSIPIEVSTNFRMLYVLTLFAGIGFDLQWGENDINVALDGDLIGKHPGSGEDVALGTASVSVQDDSGPSAGKLRFFGGLQLNLWRLKIFAQGNLAPNRAAGLTLGARLAW